jgi:hypothetical protein
MQQLVAEKIRALGARPGRLAGADPQDTLG